MEPLHYFLQGKRGVGKSTVIRKTLEIIMVDHAPILGGFFTWNGGMDDPNVYMRPARQETSGESYRLASWDSGSRRMTCETSVFDREGARLLSETRGSDLIIMDELGYLESAAAAFRQAVMDRLAGSTPVFGVLLLGDVPWHDGIKSDPRVRLIDVDELNRDTLPQELAAMLRPAVRK